EASLFRPSSEWISDIFKQFTARRITLQWRAESRVDAFSPRQVEQLAKTGLKVLDLGLESASYQQLLRMGKTTSPTTYLRRASELLKACHENGIWTKVNVLLYPGETRATLLETTAWLNQHRQYIKGVSAGPMIMYRYGHASLDFLRQIELHGARVVSESDLDTKGFADIHLSEELSNQDATIAANELARSFMSAKDYFDLKSFNYFTRWLTFERFNDMAVGVPENLLSFR
ncbi:MAG: radical SAM protein, partial [Alphaproteobacteria bacterium]|nr:radical SAM protein [Alphaproteobacteria bacterium]